jgi:hypothetical protein
MAIQIIDGFQVNTALPIDNRIVASGSTARNAIPYKYEGLRVFDTSDNIPYVYIGGTWSSENASGVLASGTTTNYIPKLNGTNVVGNSVIYQNGSNIGVSTTSPTAKLDVNGTVNATAITTADGSGILQVNATNITTGTLPLSRLQGFASTGQIIVAGSSFPSWTNQNQLSVGTSSFALTASSVKLSTSSGTSNYNYIPFVNNTSQSALYVDTSFVYDDIYNNLLVGSIRLGSTTGLTMSFGKVNYGSFTAQNNYSGVSANMTVGYVQVSNSINFKVEATFVGYTSAPFSGGGFASWTNTINSFYKVSSAGVLTQINTATTDDWGETYVSGMTTYYAYGGSLSTNTNQLIFISSHSSSGSYYAQATVSYKITVI